MLGGGKDGGKVASSRVDSQSPRAREVEQQTEDASVRSHVARVEETDNDVVLSPSREPCIQCGIGERLALVDAFAGRDEVAQQLREDAVQLGVWCQRCRRLPRRPSRYICHSHSGFSMRVKIVTLNNTRRISGSLGLVVRAQHSANSGALPNSHGGPLGLKTSRKHVTLELPQRRGEVHGPAVRRRVERIGDQWPQLGKVRPQRRLEATLNLLPVNDVSSPSFMFEPQHTPMSVRLPSPFTLTARADSGRRIEPRR